jgi:hypothetical protein
MTHDDQDSYAAMDEMAVYSEEQAKRMGKVMQMHPKPQVEAQVWDQVGTDRAMGIEEPRADRRATRIFWRVYFAILPLIILGVGMWIYRFAPTVVRFLK